MKDYKGKWEKEEEQDVFKGGTVLGFDDRRVADDGKLSDDENIANDKNPDFSSSVIPHSPFNAGLVNGSP